MPHKPPAEYLAALALTTTPPEIASRPLYALCNDLFVHSPDPGEGPDAASLYWLLGPMCWPTEPAKEKSFAAACFVDVLDYTVNTRLPQEAASITSESRLLTDLDALVQMLFGGWKALFSTSHSDSILEDFQRRVDRGWRAGAVLSLAYILHTQRGHEVKDISERKLRAFLVRRGEDLFGEPQSANALKTASERCRAVAHLWAGLFFVGTWMPGLVAKKANTDVPLKDLLISRDWESLYPLAPHLIRAMMPMAMKFQTFGVAYTPKGAAEPLIDPKSAWLLPGVPEGSIPFPEPRFDDAALEEFEDYRS
jgi:hypothetical protein